MPDSGSSDKNSTSKQHSKNIFGCHNANMIIYEMICLLLSHAEDITLTDITLRHLRKYFVSVWITKSLIRCSLSHSTAPPHIAEGGTNSRYRRKLQIYFINCRGQPTRGDITVCSLGKVLTNPHCKSVPDYETFHKVSDDVWGSCKCGNEFLVCSNAANFMSSWGLSVSQEEPCSLGSIQSINPLPYFEFSGSCS